MKIVEIVSLLSTGSFPQTVEWQQARQEVINAVQAAEWPENSGTFTIYPESGKQSNMGNGVVPIKKRPMALLRDAGWTLEYPWDIAAKAERRKGSKPGNVDAAKQSSAGLMVVEWETGNISSSHRSVNKMAMGLLQGKSVAGILIVPCQRLAQYLTDRIGNVEELRPYFPLWKAVNAREGVLEVFVIEQDAESIAVPRIPKGRDGRAKEGRDALERLIRPSF